MSTGFSETLDTLEQRFNALKPEVELSVRDDEVNIEGHVVVWTTRNAIGGPLGRCGKGGTRITPTLSLDEVRRLARTQSLKNAAAGLPLGGAKSGLRANPHDANFERQYRQFVQLVAPALRQNGGRWGGFGFVLGAPPLHATWACDELDRMDVFTGKPVEMGGTDYDKEGIAGLGVVEAAITLLSERGRAVEGATVAVQGLGAMGAAVCRYAVERGMQLTFICDPRIDGCWVIPATLPSGLMESISTMDFQQTKKTLESIGFSPMPLDSIIEAEVEVLFPCAIQDVIVTENAHRVRSRAVVEGANNPVSADGRMALFARGIDVIPDIIANPGGAIAAFVELTSKVSLEENIRTGAKSHEAKQITRQRVADNVREVLNLASESDSSPVEAAHFLAYQRIFAT